MGALPIRSKHLHVAKSGFNLEPTIRQLTTPEVMIEHYQRLARAYGIEVVTKTSGPLDHFTTTYYKTIRLGADFDEQDPYSQASTWAHEFVHVRQWAVRARDLRGHLRPQWADGLGLRGPGVSGDDAGPPRPGGARGTDPSLHRRPCRADLESLHPDPDRLPQKGRASLHTRDPPRGLRPLPGGCMRWSAVPSVLLDAFVDRLRRCARRLDRWWNKDDYEKERDRWT